MTAPQPSHLAEHIALERAIRSEFDQADATRRPDLYQDAYDRIYSLLLPDRAATPEAQSFGMGAHRVVEIKRLLGPARRVLDVGCGSGYLVFELLRAGRDAHGLDVSRVVIGQAQTHAHAQGFDPARFQVAQAMTLPYPAASFDAIISNEVLEHLHSDDLAPHLAEVRRVLRPGGWYLAWTPEALAGTTDVTGHAADDGGDGVHLNEMTLATLTTALKQAQFPSIRVQIRRPLRLAKYPLMKQICGQRIPPAAYIALERWAAQHPLGSSQRQRLLWLADLTGGLAVMARA